MQCMKLELSYLIDEESFRVHCRTFCQNLAVLQMEPQGEPNIGDAEEAPRPARVVGPTLPTGTQSLTVLPFAVLICPSFPFNFKCPVEPAALLPTLDCIFRCGSE